MNEGVMVGRRITTSPQIIITCKLYIIADAIKIAYSCIATKYYVASYLHNGQCVYSYDYYCRRLQS